MISIFTHAVRTKRCSVFNSWVCRSIDRRAKNVTVQRCKENARIAAKLIKVVAAYDPRLVLSVVEHRALGHRTIGMPFETRGQWAAIDPTRKEICSAIVTQLRPACSPSRVLWEVCRPCRSGLCSRRSYVYNRYNSNAYTSPKRWPALHWSRIQVQVSCSFGWITVSFHRQIKLIVTGSKGRVSFSIGNVRRDKRQKHVAVTDINSILDGGTDFCSIACEWINNCSWL